MYFDLVESLEKLGLTYTEKGKTVANFTTLTQLSNIHIKWLNEITSTSFHWRIVKTFILVSYSDKCLEQIVKKLNT